MHVVAVVAGVLLFLSAWLSVLRTVFTRTGHASLMSRATARAVGSVMLAIARRLPGPWRESFLGFASPLMLFLMTVMWLIGSIAGFTLFAWGVSQVPLSAASASRWSLSECMWRASGATRSGKLMPL